MSNEKYISELRLGLNNPDRLKATGSAFRVTPNEEIVIKEFNKLPPHRLKTTIRGVTRDANKQDLERLIRLSEVTPSGLPEDAPVVAISLTSGLVRPLEHKYTDESHEAHLQCINGEWLVISGRHISRKEAAEAAQVYRLKFLRDFERIQNSGQIRRL